MMLGLSSTEMAYHPLCIHLQQNSEHNNTLERVEQWLLQQNEFVAVPPPDALSLSSNRSTCITDSNCIDRTYAADDHLNYKSDNTRYQKTSSHEPYHDYLGFKKLESKQYYSPYLNRRRPNSYKAFASTPSSLDQLHPSYESQTRQNIISKSVDEHIEKVNTFPRRRRNNKQHPPIPQDLLQLNGMGQQLDKQDQSNYGKRLISKDQSQVVFMKSDKRIKRSLMRPKSWADVHVMSKAMKSSSFDDTNNSNFHHNEFCGKISRDTRRLLAGNLPDVALTAAKALHKRELSDSVAKFQFEKDAGHVRMSSAPEPNVIEPFESKAALFREETSRKASNLIRKVKAFSWPKRTVINSYSNLKLNECANRKESPLIKTESGYNTEKSEENKKDMYVVSETVSQSNIEIAEDYELVEQKSDCKSASEESDTPPERPPLPSFRDLNKSQISPQNTICVKSKVIENHIIEKNPDKDYDCVDKIYRDSNDHLKTAQRLSIHESKNISFSKVTQKAETQDIDRTFLPLSKSCKIKIKPQVAECKSKTTTGNDLPNFKENFPNFDEDKSKKDTAGSFGNLITKEGNHDFENFGGNLSTIVITPKKSSYGVLDESNELKEEKFSQENDQGNKDYDLSKSVSMSLRDLIRIHEEEIARVSGRPNNEKRKSCVIENKPKHEEWKRHTTIGLIGDHKEFHYKTQSDDIDRRAASYDNQEYYKQNLILSVSLNDKDLQKYDSNISVGDMKNLDRKSSSILSHYSKTSFDSIVSESFPVDPEYTLSQEDLLSPRSTMSSKSFFSRDVSIQTEQNSEKFQKLKSDLHLYEEQILYLTDENERLKIEFQREKKDLRHRLEEQKKVANAYQKLEDRYRRKVHELQKLVEKCDCGVQNISVGKRKKISEDSPLRNLSVVSSHLEDQQQPDINIKQVDGILHHLEQWLNNQTNGTHTDTSEVSSLIDSITDDHSHQHMYTKYKVSDHYTSPPLEIIDQIDATSV